MRPSRKWSRRSLQRVPSGSKMPASTLLAPMKTPGNSWAVSSDRATTESPRRNVWPQKCRIWPSTLVGSSCGVVSWRNRSAVLRQSFTTCRMSSMTSSRSRQCRRGNRVGSASESQQAPRQASALSEKQGDTWAGGAPAAALPGLRQHAWGGKRSDTCQAGSPGIPLAEASFASLTFERSALKAPRVGAPLPEARISASRESSSLRSLEVADAMLASKACAAAFISA